MLALHVTPASNLPSILSGSLKPYVGERSIAIERTPAVWLFPDWASLEDAQWLYELFEDDDQLAVLLVDITDLEVVRNERAGYEMSVRSPILADRLRVLCEDIDDPDAYKRAELTLPLTLAPMAQFFSPVRA